MNLQLRRYEFNPRSLWKSTFVSPTLHQEKGNKRFQFFPQTQIF